MGHAALITTNGKKYWRYQAGGRDSRIAISLGRDYEDSDGAPGSIAEHQAQILAAAADGALLLGTDVRTAIEQAKLTLPAAELEDDAFPNMMFDGLPPLTIEVAPGHSKRPAESRVIIRDAYVEHHPPAYPHCVYVVHYGAKQSTRRVHMEQTQAETESIYDERWRAVPHYDVPRSDSPGALVTFAAPGRDCKGWDPVSPEAATVWAAESLGIELADGWTLHNADPLE